jgi:hypothetical protein
VNGGWTRRRMYREETSRLAAERRFVQYKPKPGGQAEEHARALGDIRLLIQRHGEDGAWIWDPYLSGTDILKTLFFSPRFGAELRALSSAADIPGDEISGVSYVERQRGVLESAKGNLQGLRLEYRARTGQAGWPFHDRFLIFPRAETGALAWSLGASVNSLGKQHHIVQRVDDGQLVCDAFVELWDQLDGPDHLIWKSP